MFNLPSYFVNYAYNSNRNNTRSYFRTLNTIYIQGVKKLFVTALASKSVSLVSIDVDPLREVTAKSTLILNFRVKFSLMFFLENKKIKKLRNKDNKLPKPSDQHPV